MESDQGYPKDEHGHDDGAHRQERASANGHPGCDRQGADSVPPVVGAGSYPGRQECHHQAGAGGCQ